MSNPLVAVVVPTFNRRELLRSTLEALAGQSCSTDLFEVIVADDGSTDGTDEMVAAFTGLRRLSYVAQSDLGYRPGAARNAGARLATAPVLAFLDAGAMPGPGFIEATARAHADGGDVAVIGYMYAYGADDPRTAAWIAELGIPGAVQRMKAEDSLRDPRHNQFAALDFDLGRMAVPWVLFWSGNVSVGTRGFHETGGFDEDFRSWGGEDLELGLRLARRGARFVLSTEAWIVELPHPRPGERRASNLANIALIHDKHVEPACELLWAILASGAFAPLEQAYRELLGWSDAARAREGPAALAAEIEQAVAGLPAHTRVAVFGAGSWRPGAVHSALRGPGGAMRPLLADYDARWCAPADQDSTTRHIIGLRVGLGDGEADLVVITSRLRELWPRWGSALLAEAERIGAEVRVTFEP